MLDRIERFDDQFFSDRWPRVEIPPSETSPQRASILHNHNGKDLREIQELLRNIGPSVRYTQVGCELTRQTAEALVEL
jgi:hypothetical protein